MPLVATGVDAAPHPLNLLLLALPFDAGFKAWVLLSVLAAGLGSMTWARAVGATGVTAVLAGFGFMLTKDTW